MITYVILVSIIIDFVTAKYLMYIISYSAYHTIAHVHTIQVGYIHNFKMMKMFSQI